MSKKESRLPFQGDLVDMELPHKNFEARIKELEGQGFVIKEIKVEHEDLEDSLEVAKERYQKSLDLLRENGFGEFLPKTFVIIGEGSEGKQSIYIAQEKIEGSTYSEIIDPKAGSKLVEYYRQQVETSSSVGTGKESKPNFEEYPYRDILEQEDELALKSLKLWEKTRNLPPAEKEKLPISIALGQEVRRPRGEEGLMPEIMNPINMVYGRRPGKDEADKLFLVDIGLVAPDSDLIFKQRFPDGSFNDVQENLQGSLPTRLLARIKKKLIQLSDEKTYSEFENIFPRESGEFYEQLKSKYSKNTESDDK